MMKLLFDTLLFMYLCSNYFFIADLIVEHALDMNTESSALFVFAFVSHFYVWFKVFRSGDWKSRVVAIAMIQLPYFCFTKELLQPLQPVDGGLRI